jgi:hypothetical protein
MIRVYGDFNAVDAKGRIILFHADDTKSERVELREGLHVIVWDDSLEAEGILEFEDELWRANIVPGSGRYRHAHAEER